MELRARRFALALSAQPLTARPPALDYGHRHEGQGTVGAQITNFVRGRSRILEGEASEIGRREGLRYWKVGADGGEEWNRAMGLVVVLVDRAWWIIRAFLWGVLARMIFVAARCGSD